MLGSQDDRADREAFEDILPRSARLLAGTASPCPAPAESASTSSSLGPWGKAASSFALEGLHLSRRLNKDQSGRLGTYRYEGV